jgi:putative DNA methylase
MTTPIRTPKKLIEVALPLDDINFACGREKSIRHGHPSTLHLWWARRPLAAARAVIFAQMVNDPGYERSLGRGVNKEKALIERERLFGIIKRLVQWENTTNEVVLEEAKAEIWKSWRETCELNRNHPDAAVLFDPKKLPAFHDPFAGGGAIPLEAQRLGLESYATDLNPVAVLINKAMIEIPPKFAGNCPVGPKPTNEKQADLNEDWSSAKGIAEDVRRYGNWMREEAFKRIGKHYQKQKLPKELGGSEATVIAWLWTRTVKCPNPACGIQMPLLSTFILSSKKGKETYLVPKLLPDNSVEFGISDCAPKSLGDPAKGFKRGMSGIFQCIGCKTVTTRNYTAEQATTVGLGAIPTAIVCEGAKGRIYLPVRDLDFSSLPEIDTAGLNILLSPNPRDVWCRNFGLNTPAHLFTPRQLVAMVTFSELAQEARAKVKLDAINAGMKDDGVGLADGGTGATAYADAMSVFLAFGTSRAADAWSSLVTWRNQVEATRNTFARQALPMTWDFTEVNPFSSSCGNWNGNSTDWVVKSLLHLPKSINLGFASQADASTQTVSKSKVISTDPPYYDNIGYADLSDFFYVWLRRVLKPIFPELFATLAVPKAEELVAVAYRHGNKANAESFFLNGMTGAMHSLASQAHPAFPTTIYYAFKQSDTTDIGTGNTGWETFLGAVMKAGFAISGTWPMRTEKEGRVTGNGTNALASSIVLVCRPRDIGAASISRRDFLRELKDEMADAVEAMIGGSEGVSPVAPVDLAQAVIGPGMAIFSKYAAVLEADGKEMTVHTALTLINRMLTDGADEFDADSQFCLGWFDEHGWSEGEFGQADVLARAKGTSVSGVKTAGVIEATSGRVRLFKPAEYPSDWSPSEDNNTPVWEALHQMIKALQEKGEGEAGALLADMPQRAAPIRNLAYRLYTLCERKGWTDEARAYNELITSWTGIEGSSHEKGHLGSQTKWEM